MTFVSLEFASLLTVTLALYYFLPQRGRMFLLLGASYLFYAFWNPGYAILIFASTLVDYLVALVIERSDKQPIRSIALSVAILVNIGILFYFKYTDFALDSLKLLLGPMGNHLPGPLDLVLPIGISFYTFQTLSYTIDVYRRQKTAERDFIAVALFVSFFPQLVAGPIERAGNLMQQLKNKHAFDPVNFEQGIGLILWGMTKKLVISDRLAFAAYPSFLIPSHHSTAHLLLSATAMYVVVYLDFSAYSDMARGIARLFGIRLSVNFRFPYVAANMSQFWSRWHITMSTWVRDYMVLPMGGLRLRQVKRQLIITLIVMSLVGLWHGAQWTFVSWGFFNGLSLALYRVLYIRVLRHYRGSTFINSLPWRFGSWLSMTYFRVLLCILFFAPDFGKAGIFFQKLILAPTLSEFTTPAIIQGFTVLGLFFMVHYLLFRFPIFEHFNRSNPWLRGCGYGLLLFVVLFFGVETPEPFIYFQF